MLDRLFGFKIHNYLQALGLLILAFGVPINKVLMSIGTIWLASNLILKADFKEYWRAWKNNLIFWFIVAVFLLYILGLLYTQDYAYAFRAIKTELPLFVIPVALIALPIERRFFNFILYGFLLSLLITSLINYNFRIQHETLDYRAFSRFGSHIRYSLLVVTGILVAIYLFIQNKKRALIYFPIMLWLSYYTLISQVMSGYIAFLFLGLALFMYYVRIAKLIWVRNILVLVVVFSAIVGGVQLYNYLVPKQTTYSFQNLPKTTKYGEEYYHDTLSLWFENGHHVKSFIAEKELQEAWNKRASVSYFSQLDCGYPVRSILIRYMASIGLTKDREGIQKMSNKDISNVENCISSIVFTYGPLKKHLVLLKNKLFQYAVGGNPNESSLLERIEHWKAGKRIIQKHWAFGIGTGDVQSIFNASYVAMDTKLAKDHWNRAHNQFMTFWITFGLLGFVVFTGFWIWFLGKNIIRKNLIGIGFALIAIGSFLSEDTIETQQGVTYIALFLGLCAMMELYQFKKSKT